MPLVALADGCVVICSFAALPPVAVALKVTLDNPVDDTVSDCDPAVVPSVHDVSAAMPCASVEPTPSEGATLPLPSAGANFTDTPATGLPDPSVIFTAGAVATAVFTVALCPFPAEIAMPDTAPAKTLNALLATGTSAPLDPVSVEPVPALSSLKSFNVAAPATAFRVSVPARVPLPGFVPTASVTAAVLTV